MPSPGEDLRNGEGKAPREPPEPLDLQGVLPGERADDGPEGVRFHDQQDMASVSQPPDPSLAENTKKAKVRVVEESDDEEPLRDDSKNQSDIDRRQSHPGLHRAMQRAATMRMGPGMRISMRKVAAVGQTMFTHGDKEDSWEKIRKTILAPTFNIRTEIADDDHAVLLKYGKATLPVWDGVNGQQDDNASDPGTEDAAEKGNRCKRWCAATCSRLARYAADCLPIKFLASGSSYIRGILKFLCGLSVAIAPLQLALEPRCSDKVDSQEAIATLLRFHFAASLCYSILAFSSRWAEREVTRRQMQVSGAEVPAEMMAPPPKPVPRRESVSTVLASAEKNSSRDAVAAAVSSAAAEADMDQLEESESEIRSRKNTSNNARLRRQRMALMLDNLSMVGLLMELIHLCRPMSSGIPNWEQWLWLLVLLRAWRLTDKPSGTELTSFTFLFEVLKLLGVLVLVAHIGACVWVFTSVVEMHHAPQLETWADVLVRGNTDLGIDPTAESCFDVYMTALYFCSYTLTGVGYGDIVPKNRWEQAIAVIYMMLGQVCVAKIFADLNSLTATHQFWQARHYERVTQVMVALDSLGVPPITRSRALAYLDYVNEEQKQRRAQECIKDLSMPLREELNIIVYHSLVLAAPFLNSQSVPVIRSLIMSLTDAVYLPCDMIIRRGDAGQELFFIRDGRVDIFVGAHPPSWSDEPVCVFQQGHYFGEVAILTGQKRTSWVLARTFCVCAMLKKAAVEEVMSAYPSSVATLVGSLSQTCKITPSVPMEQVASRLATVFATAEELEETILSRSDGRDLWVTWAGFQDLLRRVGISSLDQKLHWSTVDTEGIGKIVLKSLISLLRKHEPEFLRGDFDTLEESNQACHKCGNIYMADATFCRKCGIRRGAPGQAALEKSGTGIPDVPEEEAEDIVQSPVMSAELDKESPEKWAVPTAVARRHRMSQMAVSRASFDHGPPLSVMRRRSVGQDGSPRTNSAKQMPQSQDLSTQVSELRGEVSQITAKLDQLVSMLPKLSCPHHAGDLEEC